MLLKCSPNLDDRIVVAGSANRHLHGLGQLQHPHVVGEDDAIKPSHALGLRIREQQAG